MTPTRRLAWLSTVALAGLAFAWAAPPSRAQLPDTVKQDTPPAPASAIPKAPPGSSNQDVLRATLPNGLQVVIVPNRLAPVVTTEINYLVGSNDAPAGFPGTAHALEHMMFRGAKGLDRDQLSELGALLGGSYNADTTETVTQYFYTAPADDLAVALRIEAGRMRGLNLNQSDWAQERGAIEQEVSRDFSSPIYTYLSQLQGILFAGTPYENDALGTRPSFDKTDATLLHNFYDQWYAPNNAVLVVAGDVEPHAAMKQVEAAFGDIPRRDIPVHKTASASPIQPKTLTLPTDFPVGLVTLAYRWPGLKDRDFYAADILADVLGSQRGALYGLVPAGHALLSEFVNRPKPDVGYALAAAAFPKGGDAQPLLAEIRQVLANIAQNGVQPDLVEAARRQELAQLDFMNDSISGLAESWSKALTFQNLNSPDDAAKAYKAVTLDDVNRLARKLLDPNQSVTAILTPQDAKKPVASAGFGGAESFGGAPDKPVVLPDWAQKALAELHLPDPGTPPVATVLDNGLRLIVQPLHVGHTISVYGQVRQVTEMQEAPGHEGVALIASKLFSYGSESLDRLAFQKALDDIAATEDAGTRFGLKVQTAHFDAGMKLLADNELHPAFPPDAFAIVRKQTAQSLAGLLQSPDYLFKRAILAAVVPKDDPSLREATPDTVMALKPEDLRAFYNAAYRPDLTTIVVAGDVTPEEARRVVEANFGAWKAASPTPAIDLPKIPANTASQAHVPDPTDIQDTVALAQTVQLPVTDPSRFTLMLGNTVLGGGFSSRLFRDLRIKTGYVYSVDSELDFSRTRCDYAVSFGSDAQNVGRAKSLVVHDIKDMQDHPVSDTELSRAKAQMLRRLPMQRASVDATAALYLRLVELGLPLDTEVTAAKRYYESTPADVQEAFRKWLRPDALAEVVKGPVLPN